LTYCGGTPSFSLAIARASAIVTPGTHGSIYSTRTKYSEIKGWATG
jgi:hypothetical protein